MLLVMITHTMMLKSINLEKAARSFLQVSHMGVKSHGFGESFAVFPDHNKGASWEKRQTGH